MRRYIVATYYQTDTVYVKVQRPGVVPTRFCVFPTSRAPKSPLLSHRGRGMCLSTVQRQLRERTTKARRHLASLERKAEQRFVEALSQYEVKVAASSPEKVPELLRLGEEARYEYLRDEVYQIRTLKSLFTRLLRDIQKEYLDTVEELIPLQRFTAFRYADPPPLPRPVARFLPQRNLIDIDVEAGDPSKTAGMVIAGAASLLGASVLGPVGLRTGGPAGRRPVVVGVCAGAQRMVSGHGSRRTGSSVRPPRDHPPGAGHHGGVMGGAKLLKVVLKRPSPRPDSAS